MLIVNVKVSRVNKTGWSFFSSDLFIYLFLNSPSSAVEEATAAALWQSLFFLISSRKGPLSRSRRPTWSHSWTETVPQPPPPALPTGIQSTRPHRSRVERSVLWRLTNQLPLLTANDDFSAPTSGNSDGASKAGCRCSDAAWDRGPIISNVVLLCFLLALQLRVQQKQRSVLMTSSYRSDKGLIKLRHPSTFDHLFSCIRGLT